MSRESYVEAQITEQLSPQLRFRGFRLRGLGRNFSGLRVQGLGFSDYLKLH